MEKTVETEAARSTLRDLRTREGFIGAIEDSGRYIIDHAEGLLGEYPGDDLSDMTITVRFRFDCVPTVSVDREHIVLPRFGGKEL